MHKWSKSASLLKAIITYGKLKCDTTKIKKLTLEHS
jgi:hypothetical protein